MSQLGVNESDDMAPGAERSRLFVDAGFPRQFGNQMGRNQIANLLEDAELVTRWSGLGFCFHPC
ncbi:MAG: hypothetical protein ACI8QF_000675 [Limisphaerales bacterium]|jgi:hypothetical protein